MKLKLTLIFTVMLLVICCQKQSYTETEQYNYSAETINTLSTNKIQGTWNVLSEKEIFNVLVSHISNDMQYTETFIPKSLKEIPELTTAKLDQIFLVEEYSKESLKYSHYYIITAKYPNGNYAGKAAFGGDGTFRSIGFSSPSNTYKILSAEEAKALIQNKFNTKADLTLKRVGIGPGVGSADGWTWQVISKTPIQTKAGLKDTFYVEPFYHMDSNGNQIPSYFKAPILVTEQDKVVKGNIVNINLIEIE